MGFPEKPLSMEGSLESEGKKWVFAGISLRAPLKPVRTTNSVEKERESGDGGEEECSTTPTAEESRIPSKLPCPPAPRKRKPVSRCNNYNGVREFFTPPDLETVFIRHVEKAN